MKLDEIGFYTLTDERAMHAGERSPMWRGEIIVTGRCNFNCIYCRRLPPRDIDKKLALEIIDQWLRAGLRNIRFSGGEPTLYKPLPLLVRTCREGGVERIGISSNGASPFQLYEQLIQEGVNDIAISLDSCRPDLADDIARVKNQWEAVIHNIRKLSKLTYVTVSIVFSNENIAQAEEIISFAHELGVADIRFVTASHGDRLSPTLGQLPAWILDRHPILHYRIKNLQGRRPLRGIQPSDTGRCYLVLDDSVIVENRHYPCGVYFREGGMPIGEVNSSMRDQRAAWFASHDAHADPLCTQFCPDFYVEYNNRCAEFREAGMKSPFNENE